MTPSTPHQNPKSHLSLPSYSRLAVRGSSASVYDYVCRFSTTSCLIWEGELTSKWDQTSKCTHAALRSSARLFARPSDARVGSLRTASTFRELIPSHLVEHGRTARADLADQLLTGRGGLASWTPAACAGYVAGKQISCNAERSDVPAFLPNFARRARETA